MPYPVSVNLPTPKELAVAAQTARESTWGMRYPPQRLPPLPGWIRVKFYSHIYKVRYEMLPDMEGEVMLDSSGGLDTRRVCKMWNLEACAPIDPMRWVQFERPDPNWLSPLAVHVLSERNKCLVFVEPEPLSTSTVHKRTFREASIHLQTSLYLFAQLTMSMTSTTYQTSHEFACRRAAEVQRVHAVLDRWTKFPMWFGFVFSLVTVPTTWVARKTMNSSASKYAQSARVSCRKRIRRKMQTWQALWVKEQLHWFLLMILLAVVIAGLFVFFTIGRDASYRSMVFLRRVFSRRVTFSIRTPVVQTASRRLVGPEVEPMKF